MSIEYDHSANHHTLAGPRAVIPVLFEERKPRSLLDVGCGTGTWLNAARAFGIIDVFGVDGVDIPADQLLIPPDLFRQQDLTVPWSLGRSFDAVLCLEVAEHLDEAYGPPLIKTLAAHADTIFFSAACPGQPGQHHVNCQWPVYWQQLFNDEGYICDDSVRWRMWSVAAIEPWYRQNLFLAQRAPERAGREPRIHAVLHPEIVSSGDGTFTSQTRQRLLRQIEAGSQEVIWYLRTPIKACWKKLERRIFRALRR